MVDDSEAFSSKRESSNEMLGEEVTGRRGVGCGSLL